MNNQPEHVSVVFTGKDTHNTLHNTDHHLVYAKIVTNIRNIKREENLYDDTKMNKNNMKSDVIDSSSFNRNQPKQAFMVSEGKSTS